MPSTTHCAYGHAPSCSSDEQLSVLVAGRPRLAGEEPGSSSSAADNVRRAYLMHGPAGFAAKLRGSFALVVLDHRDASAVLAVDRMGIEQLAYVLNGGTLAYSASAEALARLPWINAGLCEQSVYDYLYFHMVPAPGTIFAQVQKLAPASQAAFRAGRLEVSRYWTPSFADHPSRPSPPHEEAVLPALEKAVRRCVPDARTGAFLSGGLDSSTVAGLLGKVTGNSAPTFSIGFGASDYDELRYARIANSHFGCHAHEYQATAADIVRVFPLIASAYDEPFGNSSAAPTYLCAEVARGHGIDHMLAGDGGDEIFAGNQRYATQRLLQAYWKIPGAIRRNGLDPIARAIPPTTGIVPLRKFAGYVRQASVPLPRRLEAWNFMERTPADEMLHEDFRSAVRPATAIELMEDVWQEAPTRSVLDRLLFYDWHFTLAGSDLRKVGRMCELAGVRVSYPMLDEDVVDLAAAVSPGRKMRGLQLRTFYKRAMRGYLPEPILKKTKHGFGLPFSAWLTEHRPLAELVSAYLAELRPRRIVRDQFLDGLLRRHAQSPSSYLGYPIWSLAMLSAWLIALDARNSQAGAHEARQEPAL